MLRTAVACSPKTLHPVSQFMLRFISSEATSELLSPGAVCDPLLWRGLWSQRFLLPVASVHGTALWLCCRLNAGCHCHLTDSLLLAIPEALPELSGCCEYLQPLVTTQVKGSKDGKEGGWRSRLTGCSETNHPSLFMLCR